MVLERMKSRAAYRAVYLSSPLKFHTTLHAFTRPLPTFHFDAWQKDPFAWEKHKLRAAKDRKRGRFYYRHGPLAGVQAEGWPEPGLLGAGALVQVAARAQEDKLQDQAFWEQVAERAYKLRDVMAVGDLAAVLDALVSANYRHKLLMKTAAREIVDDVDKMAFIEVAVVANAYAHFRCMSAPLLDALARQATALILGEAPPFVSPGGDLDSDPGSLAVLTKSFATLGFRNDTLLSAAGGALAQRVEEMALPRIVDVLTSFDKLGYPFEADVAFWMALPSKLQGGRLATLCPALRVVARLGVNEQGLREAIVAELAQGLRKVADELPAAPRPPPGLLSHDGQRGEASPRRRLPPFAPPPFAAAAIDALVSPRPLAVGGASADAAADGLLVEEAPLYDAVLTPMPALGGGFEMEDLEAGEAQSPEDSYGPPQRRRIGWYNNLARSPTLPRFPGYVDFDPSDNFNRNRRGALLAETQSANRREVELALAASPVLRASLQGLTAGQLAASAEVFAACGVHSPANADACRETMRDIAREAIRKLSTFGHEDLRTLRAAALHLDVLDPYLERARRRRFPKALRNALRSEEAAGSPPNPLFESARPAGAAKAHEDGASAEQPGSGAGGKTEGAEKAAQ